MGTMLNVMQPGQKKHCQRLTGWQMAGSALAAWMGMDAGTVGAGAGH
jgi:hypothetical protein